jgi:hypothetical protein
VLVYIYKMIFNCGWKLRIYVYIHVYIYVYMYVWIYIIVYLCINTSLFLIYKVIIHEPRIEWLLKYYDCLIFFINDDDVYLYKLTMITIPYQGYILNKLGSSFSSSTICGTETYIKFEFIKDVSLIYALYHGQFIYIHMYIHVYIYI